MKKISISLLITLMSVFLFACGGSSDEGGSTPSSDDIVTQTILSGSSISEEPSVSLVSSDVAEVTCGENDDTIGGGLLVSCLNNENQTTLDILFVCDAGSISWTDFETGSVVDTCIKVYCEENGDGATVKTCDGSDITNSSTSQTETGDDADEGDGGSSDDSCYSMTEWYGDDYTDAELEEFCVEYEGGSYSSGNCCFEE